MDKAWKTVEGYHCKTLTRNGCTIQILRPVLSEVEQQKRQAHARAVAERVMTKYIYKKENIKQ